MGGDNVSCYYNYMDATYTFSSWNDKNYSDPFRDITKKIEKLNENDDIYKITFNGKTFEQVLNNRLVKEELRDYPNSYKKFKYSTNVFSNGSDILMNVAGIFNVREIAIGIFDLSRGEDNVYFHSTSGKNDGVIKETSVSRENYYGEEA